jgi:hypothetical protein
MTATDSPPRTHECPGRLAERGRHRCVLARGLTPEVEVLLSRADLLTVIKSA